jgi:AraC family transcriptional regulator, transcriptional activator of pobA
MAKSSLPVFHIHDFEKNILAPSPFYVNLFSAHILQNSFLSWPYRHDFFILIYFIQGTGTLLLDFEEHPVTPGSFVIMLPGQVHSYRLSNNIEGRILFFSREFLDGYASQKKLMEISIQNKDLQVLNIPVKSGSGTMFLFLFNEIVNETGEFKEGSPECIKDFLDIMLIRLFRLQDHSGKGAAKSPAAWQLHELGKLIEENFINQHLPAYYAARLHITTKYLNQLCKKHLVKTTTQLIHERLALEAKRLLVNRQLNSKQVANRLNFEDLSYFTRFFRKTTGMTPGVFKSRFVK